MLRSTLLLITILSFAQTAEALIGYRNQGLGLWPQAAVPTRFDLATGAGVRWSTPLPDLGDAPVIVVKDRVFATCDPHELLCLSADTGAILWRQSSSVFAGRPDADALEAAIRELRTLDAKDPAWKTRAAAFRATAGFAPLGNDVAARYSYPAPCSDGIQVYVRYGTGVTAAWTLDGQCRWQVRCGTAKPGNLLLAGGLLLVPAAKGMVGLNTTTSAQVWANEALDGGSGGWGSACRLDIDGHEVALGPGGQLFAPATGTVLVQVPPYGQHCSYAWEDRTLYVYEGNFYTQKKAMTRAFTLAWPPSGPLTATPTWSVPEWGGNVAPTVCYRQRLCLYGGGNRVTALDVADGQERNPFGRLAVGGLEAHRPAPGFSVAGDLLVLLGSRHRANGTITVLKPAADGRFETVVTSSLPDEPMHAPPCFADGRMYLRTTRRVICVDGSGGQAPSHP